MKITIIIPSYNSQDFIEDCLRSIDNQSYKQFEIIIVDNESTDKTVEIVKKFQFSSKIKIQLIIEKDLGIYDAINKGISKSNGVIISVLHTDDVYYDNNALYELVNAFARNKADIVYGDLIYVKRKNTNSIIRYWKSSDFKKGLFHLGWNPPHPSFFVKKNCFIESGFYNIHIGNSADIELMYRFLEKKNMKSVYVNRIFIRMRNGGTSNESFKTILSQNTEILNFLEIKNNFYKVIRFFLFKLFNRLNQFLKLPKQTK